MIWKVRIRIKTKSYKKHAVIDMNSFEDFKIAIKWMKKIREMRDCGSLEKCCSQFPKAGTLYKKFVYKIALISDTKIDFEWSINGPWDFFVILERKKLDDKDILEVLNN